MKTTIQGVLGTRADSNFNPMGGAESRVRSITSPNGGAIGGIMGVQGM